MSSFHPRNIHQGKYDFNALISIEMSLTEFVSENEFQQLSIDFANPLAVIALNKAILKKDYGILDWSIPKGYLCPPIPGRAEYIHRVADLLDSKKIPSAITVMDIGTGANCIYPIIGSHCYEWNFIATDIDQTALDNAKKIANQNERLSNKIEFRKQFNSNQIFNGVVSPHELWDITICNPPFHQSAEESRQQSIRKIKNLTRKKEPELILNFGGQNRELWCEGGEVQFIQNMMNESAEYGKNCFWFTSLVSQKDHLPYLEKVLKNLPIKQYKIIEWANGNKQTRFIAWSFLTPQQQKDWKIARWL
jgi:23S rRNA (adenine1618-N6)-methyltransferase